MKQFRKITLALLTLIATGSAVFAMAYPHAQWWQKLHLQALEVIRKDLFYEFK